MIITAIKHRGLVQRMEFLSTPGKRWRVLRQERKLTLAEMADAISAITGKRYGYNSVSRIERDEISPSVEVLEAAAEVLETTMDWLQCRSWAVTYNRPDEGDQPVYFSKQADQVARLIDEQDTECRDLCVAAVESTIKIYEERRQHNKAEWDRLFNLVDAVGGAGTASKLLKQINIEDLGLISVDQFLGSLSAKTTKKKPSNGTAK